MDNQLIPPSPNKEDLNKLNDPPLENQEKLDTRSSFKKRLKEHLLKKSMSSVIRENTNTTSEKILHSSNRPIKKNKNMDTRSMTPEGPAFKPVTKKGKNKWEMNASQQKKGNKISIKLPPTFAPEINNKSRELASQPKKIRKYHQQQCLSVDYSHNLRTDKNKNEINHKLISCTNEEKSTEYINLFDKKIKAKEIFDPNCTFSPKINPTEIKTPVIERFEEWLSKKNEKAKNIEEEIASRTNVECPFKPDITKETIDISPVKISMISVQKYLEKREYLFKMKEEKMNKPQSNNGLQNIKNIKAIKLQPVNLSLAQPKKNYSSNFT